jgi:hypothetical protein
MIGIKLADACAAALADPAGPLAAGFAQLCECIKSAAQQPGSKPCNSYPLFYRGSVPQTFVCHTATTVFQVPKGQTATITRISLAERYPGSLYGANFMLLVNDNFDPSLPRVDHPTGTGMESGLGTRICIEEQDIVSVMIQCSWFPASFTGQAETYIQTLYPFEIEGFFEYKLVA